jgi:TIR domain
VAEHIFISYSRHDTAYVQQLVASLRRQELTVWFDEHIVTGERWDRAIRDRIDTCAAFVLVMTPDAEESDWVAEEIERARSGGRPILPLLLAGRVFFGFGRLQHEDVRGHVLPSLAFIARLQELT